MGNFQVTTLGQTAPAWTNSILRLSNWKLEPSPRTHTHWPHINKHTEQIKKKLCMDLSWHALRIWATGQNSQATVPVSILACNICQTGNGPDQRLWDHPDRASAHCTLYDSRENLNSATSRKLNRSSYLDHELVSDLEAKGYSATCTLITCEILLLGHSLPVCCKTIQKIFPSVARSRYSCHVRRSSKDCYLYLVHSICIYIYIYIYIYTYVYIFYFFLL